MIDQATIDKIFQSAEIVDVVSDFIPLKKRGVNYLGLCPFHNEKTPSFNVSPSKGIYKCFGCGKGGNPVNFVMEHENFSYVEALRYLAKKYHIEIEEKKMTPDEMEQKNKRESLMIVSAFAADLFHNQLLNHKEGKAIGLSYFRERGFRDETIKKFKLGYSLDGKEAFTNAALQKGYKMEYLTDTGLTIQKGNWRADRFEGRVMFPIMNIAGRPIAFGGRTLKKEKEVAKYLNSPDSDIYHKSYVVYGIFQAKRSIIQEDKCFLVEGYTDVISLSQAGVENVVASSGTSLTVEQIRLIKRFTNNITILYDGDAAGIKASLRGIDLVLEEGMNVKVLLFPDGEDPDSYALAHSDTEIKQFIADHEEDFISFKTRLLKDDADKDPVSRARFIKDVVGSIAVIPDKLVRSEFIRQTSMSINVDEEILYTEIANILRGKREKELRKQTYKAEKEVVEARKKIQIPLAQDESERFEKEILRLLVQYGDQVLFEVEAEEEDENARELTVAYYIVHEIEPQKEVLGFQNSLYREAYDLVENRVLETGVFSSDVLTQCTNPQISAMAADMVSISYELSNLWTKKENLVEDEAMKLSDLVPSTLTSFQYFRIQTLIKETEDKLRKPMPDDELIATMTQVRDLKQISLSLAKKLGERTIN